MPTNLYTISVDDILQKPIYVTYSLWRGEVQLLDNKKKVCKDKYDFSI
jgi:hypothetical protein